MITKLRLVKKNVKLMWFMRRDFQVVNDAGSSGKKLDTSSKKNGPVVPGPRSQVCFKSFPGKIIFFSLGKNLTPK